jgi:hypothetical protein
MALIAKRRRKDGFAIPKASFDSSVVVRGVVMFESKCWRRVGVLTYTGISSLENAIAVEQGLYRYM